MPPTSYYSNKYEIARHRFRAAAATLNAQQERHAICLESCPDEDLSLDVAWIGSDAPDWTVVVSSGLHGVEGFFGSAVQLAWLAKRGDAPALPGNGRLVFIHALNPYGFRFVRRVNESNADLNRNFLLPGQFYGGRPQGYDDLYHVLNPEAPPGILDPFSLKVLWQSARRGVPALKAAIAVGQYDYPEGVFFGGKGPARSAAILQANYKRWVGGATHVVHTDLHTGLGKFATHKLLMAGVPNADHLKWCQQQFGEDRVEVPLDEKGTSYRSNGTMGRWLHHHFNAIDFTYFLAEFGTYPPVKVLKAVCADNRAYLYGQPGSRVYRRIKARLLECFCPASRKWRTTCLTDGVDLVDEAIQAASRANTFAQAAPDSPDAHVKPSLP